MASQSCSFCGRAKNEVPQGLFIKGQSEGTLICSDCATGAQEALAKAKPDKGKSEVVLLKPREIKAHLDLHIIGQEGLKRTVATAVYHHYKRMNAATLRKAGDVEIQKSNIIVLGPTGSGKTETFRAITRLLKVPFYVQDCTRITQQGYVGDDAEDMLRGLLQDAGGDVQRAEWGIILLDEGDKLARKSGRSASGYRDVTGEGAQQSLLRILEGDRVRVPRGPKGARVAMIGANGEVSDNTDALDTRNILFVFAGSFAGIEEVVSRRLNKDARLGFGVGTSRQEFTTNQAYEHVTFDDILEFGIIPELLGRLPVLTSTFELSEEDMVRVLVEPKNSLLKQFQALFAMDDIALQFDQEALLAIGREAKKRPTGARSLRSIVEAVLKPYSFDLPSSDDVTGLRITEGAVTGTGQQAVVLRRDRIRAHG